MVVWINSLRLVKLYIPGWCLMNDMDMPEIVTNIIVLCHWHFVSQHEYTPCHHRDLIVWSQQSGFKC